MYVNRGRAGILETRESSLSFRQPDTVAVCEDREFRAVFVAHYQRVLAVLIRLTGNAGDAEDLASEVFLRLSRQSPTWLLENNVGGWLYRTATHAGIDFLRSQKRQRKREQEALRDESAAKSSGPGPLADTIREEQAARVRLALGRMKPKPAGILLMRAEGEGYSEIAEAFAVSVGSVGTLLIRAEAEFRKQYARVRGRRDSQ